MPVHVEKHSQRSRDKCQVKFGHQGCSQQKCQGKFENQQTPIAARPKGDDETEAIR